MAKQRFTPVLPVEVGEVYEEEIKEMSRRGDAGMARVGGLIIFVLGAKLGQKARFRITSTARTSAQAELCPDTAEAKE